MADPFLTSAREVLERSQAEIRACIEGLGPEALNWRPAGDDTNSIAVLATHVLSSTRFWLTIAVGAPLPDRDRPSEFRTEAPSADALLRFVDSMSSDCLSLLDPSRTVNWSALIDPRLQPQDQQRLPAAWALLHALSHLREHVGQMLLTRQLWEARAARLD